MEKWEIRPPTFPQTPELMVTNFFVGDEVEDRYPCAKFHYDQIRVFCSPAR